MRGQDREVRLANIKKGHSLCERCCGTGNELYNMYRRCTKCGGTGHVTKPEGGITK